MWLVLPFFILVNLDRKNLFLETRTLIYFKSKLKDFGSVVLKSQYIRKTKLLLHDRNYFKGTRLLSIKILRNPTVFFCLRFGNIKMFRSGCWTRPLNSNRMIVKQLEEGSSVDCIVHRYIHTSTTKLRTSRIYCTVCPFQKHLFSMPWHCSDSKTFQRAGGIANNTESLFLSWWLKYRHAVNINCSVFWIGRRKQNWKTKILQTAINFRSISVRNVTSRESP